LKRLLSILSFILLIAIQTNGQSRTAVSGDPGDRIVKTYPNPAQSYITFDMQANYKSGLTLKIFNGLLGKKMYETQNMSAKLTLNLNDFSRGIYIYQLVDASGKILESGKFQVSH
jgi:Secretion system C-terminal sorting domain